MATLLVITVLLPFMGSLILVLLPKLEFQTRALDRACDGACDSRAQFGSALGL